MDEIINKFQEELERLKEVTQEEKDKKLKELDAETFYNRTKIYEEEEEVMREEES